MNRGLFTITVQRVDGTSSEVQAMDRNAAFKRFEQARGLVDALRVQLREGQQLIASDNLGD